MTGVQTCALPILRLRAASGRIESAWEIDGKMLKFRFTVPFDTEAEIVLPDAEAEVIRQQAGCAACGKAGEDAIRQDGKNVVFLAGAGSYTFCYEPTTPYRKTYSLDSTWEELNENPKARAILEQEYYFERIPFEKELCTLEELTWAPFTGRGVTKEKREKLDRMLRGVE